MTPNVQEIATVAGYALGRAARWVTDFVKDRVGVETGAGVANVLLVASLASTLSACAPCRAALNMPSIPPAPMPVSR